MHGLVSMLQSCSAGGSGSSPGACAPAGDAEPGTGGGDYLWLTAAVRMPPLHPLCCEQPVNPAPSPSHPLKVFALALK